jgi:hypothetical protein
MTIIKELDIENLIDFEKNKVELNFEREFILNFKTGSEKKIYWICRKCKITYLTSIKGKIKRDTDCKKCGYNKRTTTINLKDNKKQLKYIDNIENLIDFEKNKVELNFEREFILNFKTGSEKKIYWICRKCKITYLTQIKSKIKDNSDCNKCGLIKRKSTNIQKYGCENPFTNEEIKEKIKKSNIEKYGCENPFANEEIKQKIKQSNLERLGCEYPMQNKDVQDKSKNVCIEKYGFKNVFQNKNIKQKSKRTCIIKYNCEYANQNEKVKDKIKQTNIKKYGFEHPMQNSKIADKCNSFGNKNKLYKLPSDEIIRVQGYEPLAIDILLKKYNENDIITQKKDMPIIMYKKKTKHRYFPDIYIPKENLIIEVKSDYTYNKDLIKNILKALATRKSGYNFETWIFNNKKELLII